jgi:hypothetical protein
MDHPFHSVGEGLVNYKKLNIYNKINNIQNAPLITCNSLMNLSANKDFMLQKNILNSGLYIDFQDANKYDSVFKQLRCIAPNFIKKVYDEKTTKDTYKIKIEILQEQEALYNRNISLSKKKDPNNMSLIKLNWWKSSEEKLSAKIISEELAKIFLKNEIGRIGLNEFLFNNKDYETTVVDKNLKVHGFVNLFVSGSSVFRTSSHVHPTYTIVKLAIRLSEYISKL